MLRKTLVGVLLAAAILGVSATPAFAADWYVAQGSGSDLNDGTSAGTAFATITRGMQQAAAGDTVHVLAGVTGVYGTAGGEVFPIAMKSGVVLQGAGDELVTIQGDGTTAVISGSSVDAAARIDGFTITGGRPGLDLTASRLTVSNNTIAGNTGPGYMGAGIHSSGGSLRITGNVISDNVADEYGGGINVELGDTSLIEGNTIAGNRAGGGGGIECYYHSTPAIVGNVISGNSAQSGAGIMIESNGVGYYPNVSATRIDGNVSASYGGAVYLYSSGAVFVNCELAGNSAGVGSAITGLNSGATQLVNCTIANNTGSLYAVGRASASWPFSVTIENSIVRGYLDPGVTAAVTYSDVLGGAAGTGNIDADPLFADPASDFHLTAGSPCIDTGVDEPRAPVDIEGTARPQGAGWDMGAYEASLPQIPLTAEAGGPYAGVEGTAIELAGDASGGDVVTWAWDLDGDGEFDDAEGQDVSHAYADDFHGTVSLRVTDAGGRTATASAVVDVANAAPVLTSLTAPADPVALGASAQVSAAFTDAGAGDTHAVAVDWGDGAVSEATVDESAGSGVASATHAYARAGTFTITLALTDDDGGAAEAKAAVTVFDPSAMLRARGVIESPAGSCLAAPTIAGNARFSIDASYPIGASVPSGVVEFEFGRAKFLFVSTTLRSLFVDGATRTAELRCAGTVNGAPAPSGGMYECTVWATDGGPSHAADTLRVKVWYRDADGAEAVVYDNDPGSQLIGGDIAFAPTASIARERRRR